MVASQIIALTSKYKKTFRPGMYDVPHLLIVGAIHDGRALTEFLKEVRAGTHQVVRLGCQDYGGFLLSPPCGC